MSKLPGGNFRKFELDGEKAQLHIQEYSTSLERLYLLWLEMFEGLNWFVELRRLNDGQLDPQQHEEWTKLARAHSTLGNLITSMTLDASLRSGYTADGARITLTERIREVGNRSNLALEELKQKYGSHQAIPEPHNHKPEEGKKKGPRISTDTVIRAIAAGSSHPIRLRYTLEDSQSEYARQLKEASTTDEHIQPQAAIRLIMTMASVIMNHRMVAEELPSEKACQIYRLAKEGRYADALRAAGVREELLTGVEDLEATAKNFLEEKYPWLLNVYNPLEEEKG